MKPTGTRMVGTRTVGTRRAVIGVVAAGVVAGLVGAFPAAASAAPSDNATGGSSTPTTQASTSTTQASSPRCTPSLFGQAQQRVEAALAARVAQLNALSAAVNNSVNHLTSGDRQTLQNDVTNVELPGIQALQTQVPAVTTCAQLRTAARSMVFDYRVFVVMTPQTHLTIVIDDETTIEGVFSNLEPQIASAIQAAAAKGKDVTAAQAAFDDLKSQVTSAQSATKGQAAQLLAQTPQGFPGNWQVFMTARTNAVNAHGDLRTAFTDAQHIRADLQ